MISKISHILTLPSAPINKTRLLPECRAIYFVLSPQNELLYIGKSVNLKRRFLAHHKKHMVPDEDASIFYMQVNDETNIEEIEETLIDAFSPKLNRVPALENDPAEIRAKFINLMDYHGLKCKKVSALIDVPLRTLYGWLAPETSPSHRAMPAPMLELLELKLAAREAAEERS